MHDDDAQAVFERGDAAASLLADEAFISVMNELSGHHLAEMLATTPGPSGSDKRTHHHLMIHALQQITDGLTIRVSASTELRRHLEEETE